MDGQGTKRRKKIAENCNRLSMVHERYRQTTDRQTDRQTDRWNGDSIYSEREREFTFAKDCCHQMSYILKLNAPNSISGKAALSDRSLSSFFLITPSSMDIFRNLSSSVTM